MSPKIMPDTNKRYRLITRSDLDGLVCGILLNELNLIDDIMFAHPKDMQDGLIEVTADDITTNLPYVPGAFLSFDHHASEAARIDKNHENHIIDTTAPSAARVVYNYFGAEKTFPNISEPMMAAVDKADSGRFTMQDILAPQGWELLSFIMDARTGLGRFQDFNISNYQLMMQLIDHCREEQNIEAILNLPDVRERIDLYLEHHSRHKEMIERCVHLHGNLAVIDLRNEDTIWAGNRFIVYALYPQCSISAHILWGKNRQNTVFALGKSIINKVSDLNIGELCLSYGGGGHKNAGTCQVSNDTAQDILKEIIYRINHTS